MSTRVGKNRGESAQNTADLPELCPDRFPIVAVGASAGGIKALASFFSGTPETSGVAVVVIVHSLPDSKSILAEVVDRMTSLPVSIAQAEEVPVPGRVYIAPPDMLLSIEGNRFITSERDPDAGAYCIDQFFEALAEHHGILRAGVVLSGAGMDGTIGIRRIYEHGGATAAQDPEASEYPGMPAAAIQSGFIDFVLPAEQILPRVMAYWFHGLGNDQVERSGLIAEDTQWLNVVLQIISIRIGHDFTEYKKNTVFRRIARRMALHGIENHESYIEMLRYNEEEQKALFRELLIGVTSFFREPESLDKVKEIGFPPVLGKMTEQQSYRVWVAACSTGQDAYSIAILISEFLESSHSRASIQIFATDVNDRAIEFARKGIYPLSIEREVGRERLSQYFTKEGDSYRVQQRIRDMVVFSVQEIVHDPPFSRIDLLMCRNLMIYLESDLQTRLLTLFHYTLNPNGVLVLGTSETVGHATNLFDVLDARAKLFRRREVSRAERGPVDFPSGVSRSTVTTDPERIPTPIGIDIERIVATMVTGLHGPTAILIDHQGTILHIHGRSGRYLEMTHGPPSRNVVDLARPGLRVDLARPGLRVDLARPGLRVDLASAIRSAAADKELVVRREIPILNTNDGERTDIFVHPMAYPKEFSDRLLIVFQDHPANGRDVTTDEGVPVDAEKRHRIALFERELRDTREKHQATIEKLESANEELMSTNEELQSSNEESESSKEELQALNEELQTVNSELQSKVEELSAAHDDMHNLLNSAEVATVFVDNEVRIRRYTQQATAVIRLIRTDVGRFLGDVVTEFAHDIIADVTEVLRTLVPIEREIPSNDGTWFLLRVHPYRTIDNRIDGGVITMFNIDSQKKTQERLERVDSERARMDVLINEVFNLNENPLAVIRRDRTVVLVNRAFGIRLNVDVGKMIDSDVLQWIAGEADSDAFQVRVDAAFDGGGETSVLVPPESPFVVLGQLVNTGTQVPPLLLLRIETEGLP